MKKNPKRFKINWWKIGFLLLLSANLALIAVVAGRLLERREPATEQVKQKVKDHIKVGSFETNREQLNQTISSYLEPFQAEKLSYEVLVGSTTLMFEGTYEFFSYQVPLYIYLNPYQLEDGSIRLDIESFSVGTLPLPAQDVLRYVKSSYSFPDFVTIDPKSASIVVDLTKLKNKQGLYLKAKQIDLINDTIRLDLYKK